MANLNRDIQIANAKKVKANPNVVKAIKKKLFFKKHKVKIFAGIALTLIVICALVIKKK